jgi:hypothetical protein
MMEKLQFETRKFDAPVKRGIFCFSKWGARIGSVDKRNSAIKKAIADTKAEMREATTVGLSHCHFPCVSFGLNYIGILLTGRFLL